MLLYLPYLSSVFWYGFACFVFVCYGLPFLHWLMRTNGVLVSNDAIKAGRKTVRWKQIGRIRKGRLLSAGISLRSRSGRWLMGFPAYPIVLREILPIIIERSKNLTVPERVRRAMDVERITHIPRWVAAVYLVYAAGLGVVPVLARYSDFITFLVVITLISSLAFFIRFACPPDQNDSQHFAGAILNSLALPGWIVVTVIFADIPLSSLDTLIALIVTLFLAASALIAFRLELTAPVKIIVLVFILTVPGLVYKLGSKYVLQREDVTWLFPDGNFLPDMSWSDDGLFAVAGSISLEWEVGDRLVDFSAMQSVALPVHQGFGIVIGLSPTCVIRRISRDEQKSLYLYNISSKREICLSQRNKLYVSPWRNSCIRPDGKMVCWLEVNDDEPNPHLMVYHLGTNRKREIEIEWPGNGGIDWETSGWADLKTIVVMGFSPSRKEDDPPNQPRRLHFLDIDFEEGKTRHTKSHGRFLEWAVAPNLQYAFASGPEGKQTSEVYYMDIRSGRQCTLPEGDMPRWQRDSQYAYRERKFGDEGNWLCRFDPSAGLETRVVRIPDGSELVSLSRYGKFGIIQYPGRRLRTLWLLRCETGETRPMDVSIINSLLSGIISDWRWYPWLSSWVGQDRGVLRTGIDQIILTPSEPEEVHLRMNLWKIPEEWRDD